MESLPDGAADLPESLYLFDRFDAMSSDFQSKKFSEVGGSGDVIDSLAFDGSTAVALRRSSAGNEVIVVDAQSVEVLEIGDAGVPRSVSIARLPLSENLGL